MIIHSTDAIQSIHSDYSNKLISEAINCLEKRIRRATLSLNHSQDVCAFLRLHLAVEKHEVFAVSFLDSRHRLIQFEKLFHGTINETAVYPRRVVEKALEYNAAAVILAHNHPSEECKPSLADRAVTRELRTILKIINVQVLDHIIVSHHDSYSFAEHGLL